MILLFDVDDTLYPKSCGLQEEIRRRVVEYACSYLKLPLEETQRLRKAGLPVHGTTLRWLQLEYGFSDIEDYLDYVHPKDLNPFFQPDEEYIALFAALKEPFCVFTNSPKEHANRVLRQLGVHHLVDRLFDIRFLGFEGKPHNQAYRKVCAELDSPPEDLLLLDDSLQNVQSFMDYGGQAVLVDEDHRYSGPLTSVPTVSDFLRLQAVEA